MKTVQSRFHSLSNRVAKRAEIVSILEQAKQEKHHDIVKRLSALLDQYPSANVFELTIKKARSMRAVTSRRRIKTDDVQIEEDIVFFGLDEISEDEAAGLGKVSPADVYQMITDMMINTIKTVGHLPWQKEWTGQGEGGLLRNYVTNKPYRGINQILLSFEQKIADGKRILVPIKFQQPYYLTMNQIKDQGAQLKKGSKASIAVYYSAVYTYDDGKLKFKTSDKAKFLAFVRSNGLTATDLENHATQYRFLKYYNVFRADDCIGLKPKKPAKQASGGRKVTPIEACQQIIDNYPNPPKFRFGGDQAYYQPAADLIQMPKIEDFTSEAFFYSTFFHEMVHSTGAKHRLDRELSMDKKKYAFEELIAELGAVFLCADTGILFHTRENSAKYLNSWNKRLVESMEADAKFFTKAAAAANAAVVHIHGEDNQQEPKPEKKKDTKPVKKKPESKKAPDGPNGFAIKPKSASIKKAIEDVLTLKRFSDLKPAAASILFNVAKDKKDVFFEIESDFQKRILEKADRYILIYNYDAELQPPGEDFVNAVKNRLESLRNQKYNYAFFDGLQSPAPEIDIDLDPTRTTKAAEPQFTIIPQPQEEMQMPTHAPAQPVQPEPPVAPPRETAPAHPAPATKSRLMQMQFESLEMDQGWENFMQDPAANMKIAIFGKPKNGKTAGALQLANYLTKFGPVLYNFVDQGFNKSTQDLWRGSGLAENPMAEPSDIRTLAELEAEIASGKYKFVFIDLVNDYIKSEGITPHEFKQRFMLKYPNVSFILIMEVTKTGNFKGDQGWTHLVDAIVEVEDFVMNNTGRYGMGQHVVWPEGLQRVNPKLYEEMYREDPSNAPVMTL